jgi:amino acid transporter
MAYWILAIITFYLPLAAVVIFLNRLAPLEGGLYQWAKVAFNDFVAFMVAWNLWIFGISVMSGIGLIIKKNIAYAIGTARRWMHDSKFMTVAVCVILMLSIVAASRRGLALGKWVQNVGGIFLLITFATLILLPFYHGRPRHAGKLPSRSRPASRRSAVKISTSSANLPSGALSGFEYIAILAGECRAPARNISRSVLISAPIIALMFILGTASVLAFVPPEKG